MAAEIRIIISSQGQGSGLADAKRDVKDLGDTADKAGGGFTSLQQVAVGALRELGAAAINLAGEGLRKLGEFIGDSVNKAGDFQAGMLEFQAVAGKGVDTKGLEEFHDLFLQLGKDLPVSTAEVQQAAIELVKGGIDPATIAAGGLETSIKFAAAAMGGDLTAAAETSAKIVGGWADVTATAEDKANLLTHATDLLTKAANASTVDVADLSLGLYNVQGTAKAAGLSLDETTTALAELAPRFSNANTAGTAFRNFLVRLQPSTQPAKDAMSDLGLMTFNTQQAMQYLANQGIKPAGESADVLKKQIYDLGIAQGATAKEANKFLDAFNQSAFFDAEGKFVGVARASDILREATEGLTDAERLQYLQQIFGNDAMNAAAAFAEMGAQGYDTMAASLANANGVTENAALKQQGFNVALDNAKGSLETLQITIGEQLLPVLSMLLTNYIAPGINAITTFAEAIFGSDEAFNQLSPTLQILITIIDDLVQSFGEGGLIGLLNNLYLVLTGMPGPFNALYPIIDHLSATFNAADTPIQGFLDVLSEVSPMFAFIQGTVQAVMPAILAIIQAILAQIMIFWTAHGEEIMGFVAYVWAQINEIIAAALELIQLTIVPLLQAVAGFITAHGTEIQTVMTNTWTAMKNVIAGTLALIKGIIVAVLALIKGDFSGAWSAIQIACGTFVLALYNAIKAGLDNLRILVWEPLWNGMKSFFEGIMNGIVGWVIQTLTGIQNAITGAAGKLRAAAGGVADAIVGGITSGIANGASAIISAAKDAAMAALDAAKRALGISSPSKVFAEGIGKPMAEGMALGLTKNAHLVGHAAQVTAAAGVQGGRSQVYNSYFTYAPSINGGGMDAPLDYALAASLAGV